LATTSRERTRIGEYLVSRSAGGELPVYSENTRGTVWKTIIRKVDVSLHFTTSSISETNDLGRCNGSLTMPLPKQMRVWR
jgi:hypothetical protein